MFKIDVFIKILNDEVLLDIFLFGSDKCKDTVNKEILVHTINMCKTTKPFERPLLDRWYYFMTTFLNFFSSFTLVLKIWCSNFDFSQPIFFKSRIFFLFLNNASQVLLGSKHISVQYLTISLFSEVSVGQFIVERFNICNLVLLWYVLSHVYVNIEKKDVSLTA